MSIKYHHTLLEVFPANKGHMSKYHHTHVRGEEKEEVDFQLTNLGVEEVDDDEACIFHRVKNLDHQSSYSILC